MSRRRDFGEDSCYIPLPIKRLFCYTGFGFHSQNAFYCRIKSRTPLAERRLDDFFLIDESTFFRNPVVQTVLSQDNGKRVLAGFDLCLRGLSPQSACVFN